MQALLKLSRLIDALSEHVGRWVAWLIMAAVLISALNAAVRKAFNYSSNSFLEIQWYLFAGVFLLAAGYTLLRQEHVRIDVIIGRFSKRTQIKIELVCIVLFLFPFGLTVIDLVWPLVMKAYRSGEMSSNAGGLIRWPVFALVPLGFAAAGAGRLGVHQAHRLSAGPDRRPDEEGESQVGRGRTRGVPAASRGPPEAAPAAEA